jgi:uncharacterized protein YacL
MNISLAFLRTLFVLLSVVFMTLFMISLPSGKSLPNILFGVGIGFAFGMVLIAFDLAFRRFNLRSFNIAILGVFIGYLMGQALALILHAVLEVSSIGTLLQPHTIELIKIAVILFGVYLGTIMTLRSSDELYVSIPFVRFTQTSQKKKDLVIDISTLADPRIIDLASTGLLNHQLVIPRFVVKELYTQSELGDESTRSKNKRCLEVVKKLEGMAGLEMRYHETDFPEVKDIMGKVIRLARLLDGNILTSDISRVQMGSIEGITIINLHALSNALKPLMEGGELIRIKIQYSGKGPRQGVGHLEDGTMVVVNGGGDFIGSTIEARVLSVKHTSAGRMIFCNVAHENGEYTEAEPEGDDL